MAAEKHNQVLFKVMRDATKPEIKAAVELMFKVTVDSVRWVMRCKTCSTTHPRWLRTCFQPFCGMTRVHYRP